MNAIRQHKTWNTDIVDYTVFFVDKGIIWLLVNDKIGVDLIHKCFFRIKYNKVVSFFPTIFHYVVFFTRQLQARRDSKQRLNSWMLLHFKIKGFSFPLGKILQDIKDADFLFSPFSPYDIWQEGPVV